MPTDTQASLAAYVERAEKTIYAHQRAVRTVNAIFVFAHFVHRSQQLIYFKCNLYELLNRHLNNKADYCRENCDRFYQRVARTQSTNTEIKITTINNKSFRVRGFVIAQ